MKTTIDAAGRIVVPREVRRRAGLKAGTEVEVRYRDGVIEIEPTRLQVRLVEKGRLLVAEPLHPVEPLTTEQVQATLDELRQERGHL